MKDLGDLIDRVDGAGARRVTPPAVIFRRALMRLELPPMTLAQARCLRGLERGAMTAVRSAHRGWRAPDTAVGMLIGRVLAHYVPAANAGVAPTYEITMRGREVVALLLGDPETRGLVEAEG